MDFQFLSVCSDAVRDVVDVNVDIVVVVVLAVVVLFLFDHDDGRTSLSSSSHSPGVKLLPLLSMTVLKCPSTSPLDDDGCSPLAHSGSYQEVQCN